MSKEGRVPKVKTEVNWNVKKDKKFGEIWRGGRQRKKQKRG